MTTQYTEIELRIPKGRFSEGLHITGLLVINPKIKGTRGTKNLLKQPVNIPNTRQYCDIKKVGQNNGSLTTNHLTG